MALVLAGAARVQEPLTDVADAPSIGATDRLDHVSASLP